MTRLSGPLAGLAVATLANPRATSDHLLCLADAYTELAHHQALLAEDPDPDQVAQALRRGCAQALRLAELLRAAAPSRADLPPPSRSTAEPAEVLPFPAPQQRS